MNATTDRTRWLGLAVLSLGVSLIIVDATIVNVAIPSIIRDFDIELADAEWINTVYSLVFAALLISLGRFGDMVGRRRLYLTGLVTFVVASMLAGLSPSGGWLITARVVQGLGGAMILPATLATVNATFQGRDRAIAFGIWGSVIGGMAALGPLLGGWFTTAHSWRWAFYINLPLGVLAVAGTLAWVRETRDEGTTTGFDLPGVLTSSVGLAGLVFGLIEGQRYGWITPTGRFSIGSWNWPFDAVSVSTFAFVVAAVSLGAFVIVERRRAAAGKPVLFDFGLFRYPSFKYGNFVVTVVGLGELGLVFVLPLWLQGVLGYSAFQTGLLLLALSLGAFTGGPGAAMMANRYGPHRVVQLGMGFEVVGVLATSLLLAPARSAVAFIPVLYLYGIGVGLATAQLTSVILAEIPPAKSGQASGMQSTFRQVGSAVGIALLGTVLAVNLGSLTEDRVGEIPGLPPAAVSGIADAIQSSAGQALTGFREMEGSEAIVSAVEESFTESARRAGLTAVVLLLGGFAMTWLLPDTRMVRHEAVPEPAG